VREHVERAPPISADAPKPTPRAMIPMSRSRSRRAGAVVPWRSTKKLARTKWRARRRRSARARKRPWPGGHGHLEETQDGVERPGPRATPESSADNRSRCFRCVRPVATYASERPDLSSNPTPPARRQSATASREKRGMRDEAHEPGTYAVSSSRSRRDTMMTAAPQAASRRGRDVHDSRARFRRSPPASAENDRLFQRHPTTSRSPRRAAPATSRPAKQVQQPK